MFCFSKCVLPNGAGHRTSPNDADPQMFRSCRLQNGFNHFHLQTQCKQKSMVHLNTSPTSFEGTRGRQIGFRDPGPGNKVYVIPNYVHHQYVCIFCFGWVARNVFFPKGWQNNLPKWVCLAGRILVSLPPLFCPIVDPPNAHIRQNPKNYKELL